MTPNLKSCLDFISVFWKDNGYAPSYEEIKVGLGAKSKSSVAALVKRLEERGYITRMPNLARSIRLVGADDPPEAALPRESLVPPTPIIDPSPEISDAQNVQGLDDDADTDIPWA